MILTTAAFFSALGLAVWLLGELRDYRGIAVIGAILLIGVGSAAMIGGLEVQTGEIATELNNSTVETEHQYSPIGTTTSFPTGMVLTLLGGAMALRSLDPEVG